MNAISWTYVILAEQVNPEHGLGYMFELARTHQKASWSVRSASSSSAASAS